MLKFKRSIFKRFLVIPLLVLPVKFSAQTDNSRVQDSLDTQVVRVVKPFTPQVSDAFKVKQTPQIKTSKEFTKQAVDYTIFSMPVASTFTPAKSKSIGVEPLKTQPFFKNYTQIVFGNYETFAADIHLNYDLDKRRSLGAILQHHSSLGGVSDVAGDTDFSQSLAQINFSKHQRSSQLFANLSYQRQSVNWYGLSNFNIYDSLRIDTKQVYSLLSFQGDINFQDSFFEILDVDVHYFFDRYDSKEFYFNSQTSFELEYNNLPITTHIQAEYLTGDFIQNTFNQRSKSYGNVLLGLHPSLEYTLGDLYLNLGVKSYYLNAFSTNSNRFYIFPDFDVNYNIVDTILQAYGGVRGGLYQNSYKQFVDSNPFVAPELDVVVTSNPYTFSAGLKGRVSQTMGYDFGTHFSKFKDKPLYKSNPFLNYSLPSNYSLGNSFGIVYDNLNQFHISGALEWDVSETFDLQIKGDYYQYSNHSEAAVWNLPELEMTLLLAYHIGKKWFASSQLFYLGSRFDQTVLESDFITSQLIRTVSLDEYLDLNANVTYQIDERWAATIKAQNIFGNSYERWSQFPVQGLQILAGASYNFDLD